MRQHRVWPVHFVGRLCPDLRPKTIVMAANAAPAAPKAMAGLMSLRLSSAAHVAAEMPMMMAAALMVMPPLRNARLVAGVALCVAAVAVSNNHLLLVGLGMVLGGIGEFINHERQSRYVPGGIATGYPRRPRVAGLLFDALGLVVGITGLLRLLNW